LADNIIPDFAKLLELHEKKKEKKTLEQLNPPAVVLILLYTHPYVQKLPVWGGVMILLLLLLLLLLHLLGMCQQCAARPLLHAHMHVA
jgi:hypothetical protein